MTYIIKPPFYSIKAPIVIKRQGAKKKKKNFAETQVTIDILAISEIFIQVEYKQPRLGILIFV